MDLVIKNGHLVTHKDIFRRDIGIQAGKIAKIAKHIMETSFKGVRSSDDFSTGTRAAEPVG